MLEDANHRALVIPIPEHGMALRNTRVQMSTLRELPLPSITTIPVGLRFTGVDRTGSARTSRRVNTRLSYQAIAHLLSEALEHPPFDGAWEGIDAAFESMPETPFLSDNNSETMVLEQNGTYFLYAKGRWAPLPDWRDLASDSASAP